MGKYGLKFENKSEECVDKLNSHHIFLEEKNDLSFVRNQNKINNINNDKIKKSLIELTKVFKQR